MRGAADGTGSAVKSVILLGASSMLGQEIARQLATRDIDVITAGRRPDSDIVIDLASDVPPEWAGNCSADVLIHCASAFGDDSEQGIRQNIRANVGGCIHALEIAKRAGVQKIIYAGSISSDSALELGMPLNSYGFTKAEAERLLEWGINRTGGTFCSLRLPQLWDTEGACCAHQPWFGRIIAYASRGQLLNMPSSDGPRNFMHVSDAAQLFIRAGESALVGTHAVCYPVDIDMAELAHHAYRIFGQGGGIAIDSNKKPFRKMRFPHEEHVFGALNYYPQISPEQGLSLIHEAGTANRFGPVDVL